MKYLHVGKLASQQSSVKGRRERKKKAKLSSDLKEKSRRGAAARSRTKKRERERSRAKQSEAHRFSIDQRTGKRTAAPGAATQSENGQSGLYENGPGMRRRCHMGENPCIYFTTTKLWPPAEITELASAAITARVLRARNTKAR